MESKSGAIAPPRNSYQFFHRSECISISSRIDLLINGWDCTKERLRNDSPAYVFSIVCSL